MELTGLFERVLTREVCMKGYIMSALFLCSMAVSLWSLAAALEQFNRELAKALFSQPTHGRVVAAVSHE